MDTSKKPDVISETTLAVLKHLESAPHGVTGETICRDLGNTRTAVWKHIKVLRKWGYVIASAPHRGYRLNRKPDTPVPWEIQPLLQTRRIGKELVFFREVHSTNHVAVAMANEGAPDGTVATADAQTAGRGRQGRSWISPDGVNLYVSVILRPTCSPRRAPQTSLVAALALARIMARYAGDVPVGIKWPNDVLVGGRKIAGILCEMTAEPDAVRWLVLGVGVNVNADPAGFPEEIAEVATSLRQDTGERCPRSEVLAGFLNEFESCWDDWLETGLNGVREEFHRYCIMKDRVVAVRTGRETVRGTARGIAADGALLLEAPDGTVRSIYSGDVHIGSGCFARGKVDISTGAETPESPLKTRGSSGR